ncbi:MAG: hypothetical protein AAB495_02435 [Patescibacteria group bacterium]
MNGETKQCQNCKQDFVIEPEDFGFYKKMDVPPPTFCSECRMRRRMFWRNERTLYKRKCQVPGHEEELVSIYAPDKAVVAYDQKYWWSDAWDPTDFGQPYDFSKPFFAQFGELLSRVPLLALSNSNAVNSDYCNVADQSKDSYLCSGSFKIEKALYSNRIFTTTDSADLYVCSRAELSYDCVSCNDSYRLLYSQDCRGSRESYFLYDCRNCSNCVGCTSLRNKQYCMWNVQYTKEEYAQKLKELKLDSRTGVEEARKRFQDLLLQTPRRYAQIYRSVNIVGDNVEDAKNCFEVFDILEGLEDSKYVHWGGLQTKDSYDCGPGIGDTAELMYETTDTGLQSANVAFTYVVYGSQRIRYALYCHGSADLFGCIGLRSKKFCILNRQYSEEEYKELLPKVIRHVNDMPYIDAAGRQYAYGEFFPEEISPFAYNESIAQDYFPITREEALTRGYSWHENTASQHAPTRKAAELSDSISDVGDEILKEIIECGHGGRCNDGCSTAFRFIPQELEFYRRLGIPLPQLCFNCRHKGRVAKRNPMKLWERACACAGRKSENARYENTASHPHGETHCPKKFSTTYAPERPETVYCDECYQAEVV